MDSIGKVVLLAALSCVRELSAPATSVVPGGVVDGEDVGVVSGLLSGRHFNPRFVVSEETHTEITA